MSMRIIDYEPKEVYVTIEYRDINLFWFVINYPKK